MPSIFIQMPYIIIKTYSDLKIYFGDQQNILANDLQLHYLEFNKLLFVLCNNC